MFLYYHDIVPSLKIYSSIIFYFVSLHTLWSLVVQSPKIYIHWYPLFGYILMDACIQSSEVFRNVLPVTFPHWFICLCFSSLYLENENKGRTWVNESTFRDAFQFLTYHQVFCFLVAAAPLLTSPSFQSVKFDIKSPSLLRFSFLYDIPWGKAVWSFHNNFQ